MIRRFLIASIVVIGLAVGGILVFRLAGLFGSRSLDQAQPVPRGDQEIVWLDAAATGAPTWERFIAGVRRAQKAWPGLQVDTSRAFPDLTTVIPEISLSVGTGGRLWVRWYKLTSDLQADHWVERLARRDPPPLAIIGGGSSDRARQLAIALKNQTGWQGPRPLMLITTATADLVLDDSPQGQLVNLMDIYPGRSFRFCFTNRQMADAVVDFVWSQPNLRPRNGLTLSLGALPGAGSGDVLGPIAWLAAGSLPSVFALQWLDDPYSIDLADRFAQVLSEPHLQPNRMTIEGLEYSVGGFWAPNPPEGRTAGMWVADIARTPLQRTLIVLPAVDRPLRRFLRALAAAAPVEVRDVVAVTGDSLSFNIIYRDREWAWSGLELPVPLVFFSHQNPVAWPELETGQPPPPHASATNEELFNAELIRLVLEAAFPGAADDRGPLLADADALAVQLHAGNSDFFDPAGNRRGASGEFVICRLPHVHGDRVLPSATIEVWQRSPDRTNGTRWRRTQQLTVDDPNRPAGRYFHAQP